MYQVRVHAFFTKRREKLNNKIMPLTELGMMAAGQALDTIGGLAMQGVNDRRQLRQQQKLMQQQIKGQKEMGKFNQALALEMWDKTNYKAQVEQLKKAGLNVGLMYDGGGASGTTQTPTGSVSGGNAPVGGGEVKGMGMQLGMQMALLKAQKENIEADTAKKQAETTKTSGADTAAVTKGIEATDTQIQQMKQATKNSELQNSIMEYEKKLKEIEANKANLTQEQYVEQMKTATEKLKDEARSAKVKGNIDEATEKNVVENANLVNQNLTVQIGNTKATTEQTKQATQNLKQDKIS